MPSRVPLAFLACIAASGCAQLSTLPDGQKSFMSPANNAARAALPIAPTPTALSYRAPAVCQYASRQKSIDQPAEQKAIALTIRPVADKLSIVETSAGQTVASVLIDRSGKLLDYNSIPTTRGATGRYTPETAAAMNAQMLQSTARSHAASNPHALNEASLKYPEYISASLQPGQTAGFVLQEDRAVWGTYFYRGMTTYQGRPGALLDLQRVAAGSNPAYLVGYDIVDPATGLPLLAVLDSGASGSFEQLSCK